MPASFRAGRDLWEPLTQRAVDLGADECGAYRSDLKQHISRVAMHA